MVRSSSRLEWKRKSSSQIWKPFFFFFFTWEENVSEYRLTTASWWCQCPLDPAPWRQTQWRLRGQHLSEAQRANYTNWIEQWSEIQREDGQKKGLLHTLQLLSKHGEENSEVDWAAGLLDHSLQLLILHIQLTYKRETRTVSTDSWMYLQSTQLTQNINAPIEANTSLRSSLLMMPSLFWSMIVKAYVCRRDKRQEHCYSRRWWWKKRLQNQWPKSCCIKKICTGFFLAWQ